MQDCMFLPGQTVGLFPMYIFVILKTSLESSAWPLWPVPVHIPAGLEVLTSTLNKTGIDLLRELVRVITQPLRKSLEERYFAKNRDAHKDLPLDFDCTEILN